MKLDFLQQLAGNARGRDEPAWRVGGETQRLTDVLVGLPSHLEPVPCCSVTRDSLAAGFATDRAAALAQHRQLRDTLAALGVRCHLLAPQADMPDLCFTRDTAVTTPWGPVILNPALGHRRPEADQVARRLSAIGAEPVLRISEGFIEGGDVCVARQGLLIIGQSGERTDAAGADALARWFEARGWEVLICPFDPRHLHLDTIFCMLDANRALAQIEALDAAFVAALARHGIELLGVTEAESRALGCNIVSIDGETILMRAGHDRIERLLRDAGFKPVPVEIAQFAACGGGVHCLTLPLARTAA